MMIDDDYPPTPEQWEKISPFSRFYIAFLVWKSTILPRLPLPLPVHFGILASLYTFLILAQLPQHPMMIPVSFGGGLSSALMMVGGIYARTRDTFTA